MKAYGRGRTKDELDGYTDFDKQRIYISKDLHPYRKGVTLTHELLHVIADSSGDYDDEAQEDYIRRIEHGVFELLDKFPDNYKIVLEDESGKNN